jgi:transmembrane sensor
MKHRKEKDELLITYLSGSASEQERQEALNYIRASEENKAHFDELKKYYQLSLLALPTSDFSKEEGWARIRAGYYKQLYAQEKQKHTLKIKSLVRQFALPLAASLILAFLFGTLVQNNIFKTTSSTDFAFNEITAPYGARSIITLPDSTTVWLNAGSKLRYPSNFSENNREVYLEGEAFFDVTKNEKNIFKVNAGDILINVYGTQFNVKAYSEEQEIITTLVTGSISIDVLNLNSPKAPLILEPNQSATFHKAAKAHIIDENKDSTAAHSAEMVGQGSIERIAIVSS